MTGATAEPETGKEAYADLLEWALAYDCVVETPSGYYRVVETGFLGNEQAVRGYIKGMVDARNIDAEEWPTHEQDDDVSCKMTNEPHESLNDGIVDTIEKLK